VTHGIARVTKWLVALIGGSALGLALRLAFFFIGALMLRTVGSVSSVLVPSVLLPSP